MEDNPYDFLPDQFPEAQERARDIYLRLKKANLRIFNVCLDPNGTRRTDWLWIHHDKTTEQWREDIRAFIESSERSDDDETRGRADDDVHNALGDHLRSLGYAEVGDVAADVFEGRVTNHRARLAHDPAHEEQADGFGHYGWDNGRSETEGTS